jgi:hypothetical protein
VQAKSFAEATTECQDGQFLQLSHAGRLRELSKRCDDIYVSDLAQTLRAPAMRMDSGHQWIAETSATRKMNNPGFKAHRSVTVRMGVLKNPGAHLSPNFPVRF